MTGKILHKKLSQTVAAAFIAAASIICAVPDVYAGGTAPQGESTIPFINAPDTAFPSGFSYQYKTVRGPDQKMYALFRNLKPNGRDGEARYYACGLVTKWYRTGAYEQGHGLPLASFDCQFSS